MACKMLVLLAQPAFVVVNGYVRFWLAGLAAFYVYIHT